jgi:spore maturation protein CgeB
MKKLASFRDIHRGATVIVCGCGASLNELTEPERFITIGVNDVGRRFHPNYLVVVNPPNQFTGDRFSFVENSQAEYIFTQLDLGLANDNIVTFNLGTNGGTDLNEPNVLHFTQNSPYVALCLAVHTGATRIGLIGVDFTDNHFFAETGMHPLLSQLPVIDEQYKNLYQAIRARGVEVFNLSSSSRLTTFPKMSLDEFTRTATTPAVNDKSKIFFINYRFLSCGEVFTDGLRNAAASLGLSFRDAYWDDPQLSTMIREFAPDWLFVVHGRRFVQKWRGAFPSVKKAVWLLDEPYEVDDTSNWSTEFDTVFVNDPSTLQRHHNAHYLPVAYDPKAHYENGAARTYNVGFIGGHNEARERYLLALAQAGHLSYIVGGPWQSPQLQTKCLAHNIPARQSSDLYRQTRIVVNLFREVHHFNRDGIPAYSMNPRVYEALACGAVVVSETRGELSKVFPELPLFSNTQQLLEIIRGLETNDEAYQQVKTACQQRLQTHNYTDRLSRVLEILDVPASANANGKVSRKEIAMKEAQPAPFSLDGWVPVGQVVQRSEADTLSFDKPVYEGPGSEQGLASAAAYRNVELSFEVKLAGDTCFIAKVRQASQQDQATNSYHLYCSPGHAYLARHNHIFQNVSVGRETWQRITLRCRDDRIELEVNGALVVAFADRLMGFGYCFVGCKNGKALVRNLVVQDLGETTAAPAPQIVSTANGVPTFRLLHHAERLETPVVSIITTVYDRVNDLADCLKSVQQLRYRNFEHIIVSDHPSEPVVACIEKLVKAEASSASSYADLNARVNNWGIAPASVGLHLARGKYVCFLSDDNGYRPDHFDPLVNVLDQNDDIAFAYSSCQYAGRFVLRNSTPLPGGIDLGQPLFRKDIFDRYLPARLPFDMMAWDWHMIQTFMQHGLRWQHVDQPTFLFRLAACNKR